MRRFILSGWWVCVLTVGVSLSVLSTPSRASFTEPSGGNFGGGGDPGVGVGDPDLPQKSGKFSPGSGRAIAPPSDGIRTAGSGATQALVWKMKLQALLQALRMQKFGF